MKLLLTLIPILTVISAFWLYKYNGRKEIFRFDLVQFVYAFVITPLFFIWIKTFVFYLLKDELGIGLTVNQLFIVDTAFSVLMFYIFAFVVIHSLTKTFKLNLLKRPDSFDIMKLSEYFHMWFSHLVIYSGFLLAITLLSVINLLYPLDVETQFSTMMFVMIGGLVGGGVSFMAIWNYNPSRPAFFTLMKALIGLLFALHIVLYFLLEVRFSLAYAIYWYIFMSFASLFIISLFITRSSKALVWWNKLRARMGLIDKFL